MAVTILSSGTFFELDVSLKHFFSPLSFFNKAASLIHPKEIPPEAILLAVYLELQNGKELGFFVLFHFSATFKNPNLTSKLQCRM